MLPSCGVLYFPYAIRVNFISISILTISPFDFPPLFILSSLLSPLKYSVFFTPIFSSVMCCFDELILFLSFRHHHIGLGSIHQLSNHSHHIPFHPIHQFASQLVSQSVGCNALYVIISMINLNQSIKYRIVTPRAV